MRSRMGSSRKEVMKRVTIPIEGIQAAMLLVIMIVSLMAYWSKDDRWP